MERTARSVWIQKQKLTCETLCEKRHNKLCFLNKTSKTERTEDGCCIPTLDYFLCSSPIKKKRHITYDPYRSLLSTQNEGRELFLESDKHYYRHQCNFLNSTWAMTMGDSLKIQTSALVGANCTENVRHFPVAYNSDVPGELGRPNFCTDETCFYIFSTVRRCNIYNYDRN